MINVEDDQFLAFKKAKLHFLPSILKPNQTKKEFYFDSINKERKDFGVKETDNVSSHGYDKIARNIVSKYSEGIVLDCGAGLRDKYYRNVVNFEIENYPTTDVLGVADNMPFKDQSFDAVLCLNVLEHVSNPFAVAQEIVRVLKKNGELYCVVPFLQPLHGYPEHYYNMTREGIVNLFNKKLHISDSFVYKSGHPIHSLRWIVESWSNGLPDDIRERFLNLRIGELLEDSYLQLEKDYAKDLNSEKVNELASTNAIIGYKK